MFVLLPGMGFGMGAGVLVGQNLGAGQPERAERSGWVAVGILQIFMVICCTAFLLWAEHIIGIFTKDPELVEIGATFIRIATSGFVVIGFVSVLQNCIAGAGDTVPNMIVNIVAIWIIQIPLAALLSRYTSLGVYGIIWAMAAGTISTATAYTIYFRLGRWKHKKV
jgi:Na+-driven multidrug efflux pump